MVMLEVLEKTSMEVVKLEHRREKDSGAMFKMNMTVKNGLLEKRENN